jgi:hypothetical protein
VLTPEGFRFREFLEIREKQVVQVVKGLPRANAARALWLGLPFLWIGIAHAQVTYTPLQAPGIVVTGIRSNSSTTDDVVVTGSLATGGTTTAALYSGSLQALPTTATSGWNFPTPNFGASQTVTSSTFYGPNTPLFDTSLPAGDVRAVGSYKYSQSPDPNFDHGMIYQGPVAGGGTWTQIDPVSLVPAGETLNNTIAHSTMGNLVVGNWDTNLAVGRAFVYNLSSPSSPWTNLVVPTAAEPTGSKSVTAYGIWQNSGTSYTIAGGLSDLNTLGVDESYLADYDPATGLVSHVRTYNFDNLPITSLITHFDGITGTATGYNLTGDYFNPGSGPDATPVGAFFASVRTLPNGDFGDATWTNIAFTNPSFQNIQFTSGNTVLDNSVLGIFSGVALPCGPCEVVVPVTLSYVATVPAPEPGALSMLAVGLGMLGLIRLRSSAHS